MSIRPVEERTRLTLEMRNMGVTRLQAMRAAVSRAAAKKSARAVVAKSSPGDGTGAALMALAEVLDAAGLALEGDLGGQREFAYVLLDGAAQWLAAADHGQGIFLAAAQLADAALFCTTQRKSATPKRLADKMRGHAVNLLRTVDGKSARTRYPSKKTDRALRLLESFEKQLATAFGRPCVVDLGAEVEITDALHVAIGLNRTAKLITLDDARWPKEIRAELASLKVSDKLPNTAERLAQVVLLRLLRAQGERSPHKLMDAWRKSRPRKTRD